VTPRPDPDPADLALLLDSLQGELDAVSEARLGARLAAEPALARAREAWVRLAAAEKEAFEPEQATQAARADAPRLAAWIRGTVAREETARTRTRFTPSRQRSWARILAWSVGLHVVVLGCLAAFMAGGRGQAPAGESARIALEGGQAWDEVVVDPADAALAIRFERIRWEDLGAVGDRLALGESESLADELRDDLESVQDDQPIAWDGPSHPVGVVVAMSRRKNSQLKQRRLDLLGFNADGTLRAVERGLRHLGRQQRVDGSFEGDGGHAALGQTALVLLPFLAEGHTSRGRGERDAVVARGVTWLRTRLFGSGPGDVPLVGDAGDGLGLATVALCEDYMLSFGDLPPLAAGRRATEIAALVSRVRERSARSTGEEHMWDVWALDAAARADVVPASQADQRVFRAWVEAAASVESEPQDTLATLSAGTALLFAERGAQKPRFLRWSHANAERLVGRLDPTGRARSGNDVGDTALILLALQVAYRTY